MRKRIALTFTAVILLIIPGCRSLWTTKVMTETQATRLAIDITAVVYNVLLDAQTPNSTVYDDEEYFPYGNGYALYSGEYVYSTYGSQTTHDWKNFAIEFHNLYSSRRDMTIHSGKLTIKANQYWALNEVEPSGYININGTVTVEGEYDGEQVYDTVTVDFNCLLPNTINQDSTLSNSNGSFDIFTIFYL